MDDEHLDEYGDTGITSAHAPIPKWIIWLIPTLFLWGLLWFFLFWNGSWGWLDRGHWFKLQQAANTTFPEIRESRDEFPN